MRNVGRRFQPFIRLAFLSIALVDQGVHANDPLRAQNCLNGWWDFLPDLSKSGAMHHAPGAVPKDGWLAKAILVPGSWSRGEEGADNEKVRTDSVWSSWRMSDSYGYPKEWDATNTAWYRRSFRVHGIDPLKCYVLKFGGVLRESWIFVNGREAGRRIEGIMPSEHDITALIRPGENELAVFCTDYKRDENGRTFVLTGHDQMRSQKGIWQDVFLEERPGCFISDLTLRTSVRRNTLEVEAVVNNESNSERTLTPEFRVLENDIQHLRFSAEPVRLGAGEIRTVRVSQKWEGYIPWSPETPQLYHLGVRLIEKGKVADETRERFGFREIWIEGHRILLNGSPIRLYGEWGHKDHFSFFRPEYIRQWYRMLKDLHMNYIRTHTYPHPRIFLDLADEMGIFVSLESGWFFSGSQALDKPELWRNAEDHVRAIVGRDKNHPSVVLWSVGNEVRWGWNLNALIQRMPRLYALYDSLDPTRITYQDGSSSLWDEKTQHLISRHYGFECTGEDGWDRSKPLHAGEFGKWHFGQPVDNAAWGDDGVFASFFDCHRAVASEAAEVIEQARANEVSCIFPWNVSCLDNFRPWPEEKRFEWPDPESPGVKPLRSGPHASEFAWWDNDGKGYSPGVSFEIIKRAYRPLAVVAREKRGRAFDDGPVRHTLTLVNDTGGRVAGTLSARLIYGDAAVWERSVPLTVEKGFTHRDTVSIPLVPVLSATEARIETEFFDRAQSYDRQVRNLRIIPRSVKREPWTLSPMALYEGNPAAGDKPPLDDKLHMNERSYAVDHSIRSILESHGIHPKTVARISDCDPRSTPLLVITKNAVDAGSCQNRELARFVSAGGRAVVLEQNNSILPQVDIQSRPAERCHIRGGGEDLLAGFSAPDFEYWGDDPFGKSNSDSWVTVRPYVKPSTGNTRILLDSGWGDFGGGGLNWSPLFETRTGRGLVIACQLRVTDKAGSHPAALALLRRMLEYASAWKYAPGGALVLSDSADAGFINRLDMALSPKKAESRADVLYGTEFTVRDAKALSTFAAAVAGGSTGLIRGLTAETVPFVARAFGLPLRSVDLGSHYHMVRVKTDPLLEGISNQETYWLDRCQYCPETNVNRFMTDCLLECPGAEVLLASESESCWREFYTQGAMSEWFRMPVITHFLWNGPRPSAAGMIRVKYGKGQLLVCQVPMPDDGYRKAEIFWSQFFRNLGLTSGRSPLEGEATIAGGQRSAGFPGRVRFISDPSTGLLRKILAKSDPGEARINNQGLSEGFDWKWADCPGGIFKPSAGAKEVVLFFETDPGRPRKAAPAAGGWPDPSQQTLLDLWGAGSVRMTVNGKPYAPVSLDGAAKGTVADVDLEAHWDTVVLVWSVSGDSLRMLWRDRQGRPEVEFGFN